MPNWCMNKLEVTGPVPSLVRFRAKAKSTIVSDGKPKRVKFSLGAFLPMPKELEGTRSPSPKPNPTLVRKYGADNWYDWRQNHYGTKWDVDAQELLRFEKEKLGYTFDSAWSPPAEGIRRISELYPDLTFTLEYDEPSMDFAGTAVFRGGEVIEDTQTKSQLASEDE